MFANRRLRGLVADDDDQLSCASCGSRESFARAEPANMLMATPGSGTATPETAAPVAVSTAERALLRPYRTAFHRWEREWYAPDRFAFHP
jgi:hypothetical protein